MERATTSGAFEPNGLEPTCTFMLSIIVFMYLLGRFGCDGGSFLSFHVFAHSVCSFGRRWLTICAHMHGSSTG